MEKKSDSRGARIKGNFPSKLTEIRFCPRKRGGSPFRVPAGHAVSLPNMAGRGILSTARARTTLAGAGRADRFVPLRERGDEAAASAEKPTTRRA